MSELPTTRGVLPPARARRWCGRLLLVLFVSQVAACVPTPLQIFTDYEELQGGGYSSCGEIYSALEAGDCVDIETMPPGDRAALECLEAAWRRCDRVYFDDLFRNPSGGTESRRFYLEERSNGECAAVLFTWPVGQEMVQAECSEIAIAPVACATVEGSECSEVDRMLYSQPRL